jgi:hypothetical protein
MTEVIDHSGLLQATSLIATLLGAVGGVAGLVSIIKAIKLYGSLNKSVETLEQNVPVIAQKLNDMTATISGITSLCNNRGGSCGRTFDEIKEHINKVEDKAQENAEGIIAVEGRITKEMIKEVNAFMSNSLAKSINDIKEVFKKR